MTSEVRSRLASVFSLLTFDAASRRIFWSVASRLAWSVVVPVRVRVRRSAAARRGAAPPSVPVSVLRRRARLRLLIKGGMYDLAGHTVKKNRREKD